MHYSFVFYSFAFLYAAGVILYFLLNAVVKAEDVVYPHLTAHSSTLSFSCSRREAAIAIFASYLSFLKEAP